MKSRPTLCYPRPYLHRKNLTYWIQLKTGRYCITPRASLIECIKAYIGCKAYGLTFKAKPLSNENQLAYILLLNLFYNRLTDRKHFTIENEVVLNE